ncbi:MAG: hypothetical protein D6690_11360 [Nitrospirae bacterium]|nr:MAG: hypothetical protein D6690_11360 [Nitrospirota bacterium]
MTTSTPSLATIQRLCPDVDSVLIEDFLNRMDPEYYTHFAPKEIAKHLGFIAQLSLSQPGIVEIHPRGRDEFDVLVVAYDYFAEFATFCGLLAVYGLDIREALIFTYQNLESESAPSSGISSRMTRDPFRTGWHRKKPVRPPGLMRKKVVDQFRVRLFPGFAFGPEEQQHFEATLREYLQLLEARQFSEVRARVNRQLAETLGKLHQQFPEFSHPVHIRFDNTSSTTDTIVEIQGTDTPAFLYTFANALSMRRLYLVKALIDVDGTRVRNRLYVRQRHGGKIESKTDQQELAVTAALMKEFTHYLSWAPDPAKALEHFDQLLDQLRTTHTRKGYSLLQQGTILAQLAKLFGSSDYLWEDCLRRQHAVLFPAMKGLARQPLVRSKAELTKSLRAFLGSSKDETTRKARLNAFKDRELFRIDMKHLVEHAPLQDFSLALTNLAEVIIEQAIQEARRVVARTRKPPRLPHGRPCPFAVFGLGKLGGRELGYASDIEVLFVYDTGDTPPSQLVHPSDYYEALVQEMLRWIEAKREGIFHIDTRLRPHGDKGLLANSFQEIRRYYDVHGMAAPFERQALIKLRHIAGDRLLGRKVEAHRDAYVYSREPWPLDVALGLRERQMKELVPAGSIHVKYSPGGLIDIEYTVQYLQLMHGWRIPALRTPNTLEALTALRQQHLLSEDEATALEDDYLFFRQLIDALRMVRGNAQDLVLPSSGSEAMIFLARRLGFVYENWKEGALALEREISRRMARAHRIFCEHFAKARLS